MTAHLGACPCGGLAHAQHRLVLGAIQPTNREAGAANPSHHGDVAVSEEPMQKMIHGEKEIGELCKKERERERSSEGEKKPGCAIISGRWCRKSSRFILFFLTFTEM